jgi:hypothetical protein
LCAVAAGTMRILETSTRFLHFVSVCVVGGCLRWRLLLLPPSLLWKFCYCIVAMPSALAPIASVTMIQ